MAVKVLTLSKGVLPGPGPACLTLREDAVFAAGVSWAPALSPGSTDLTLGDWLSLLWLCPGHLPGPRPFKCHTHTRRAAVFAAGVSRAPAWPWLTLLPEQAVFHRLTKATGME